MSNFSLLSKNFILICLSGFFYFGSFYFLLPTIPQFVAKLGGTTSQIGLVIGLFSMATVIFRPYCAKLADRHGRKKMMIIAAGLFAMLFMFYDQVHEITPLYVLRVVHGIALGSYLAAAYAYVADFAPIDRRGEVMGVYGVANVVAMALFPAWGSMIIADTQDFSRLFFLATITGGAAFFAAIFIDELKPEERRHNPVSLRKVACKPAVLVASMTFFSAAIVYGAVITFLPVYAPERGITDIGIYFTTYALFTLFSRLIAGKLSDRYGRRKVILPFLMLLAIAMFLLPFLNSILMLVVIGGCFGLGFGAFMPALSAFVVDRTSAPERASALAFFTAFMDIGIMTGALFLGIIGEYWGYGLMYGVGGIIVCLGVVLFAIGSKEAPKQNEAIAKF